MKWYEVIVVYVGLCIIVYVVFAPWLSIIEIHKSINHTAPAYNISGNEYFPYRTAYFNGVKDGQAIARPKGEWVMDSDNIPICENCGEVALQRIYVRTPQLLQEVRMVKSNFCPNCGAEMRKELPKPDPKKLSPYHDTYRDALFDEALDELERKERGSGE